MSHFHFCVVGNDMGWTNGGWIHVPRCAVPLNGLSSGVQDLGCSPVPCPDVPPPHGSDGACSVMVSMVRCRCR